MDVFDPAGACASVREFLEVLTNWYVRRSRDRFWAGDVDAVQTVSFQVPNDWQAGRIWVRSLSTAPSLLTHSSPIFQSGPT